MDDRRLERLFLRFRKRGDAAALGEVFDRTAPELLGLAMHLVRDPVEAEDVVQSTFLAAIEGAASYDSSRRLMPWLVGILARQAGLVRRRSRRAVEPDRLAIRGEADPADLAQAQEFSAELATALASLPETYREVLRLHLADGRRPVEIAQHLRRAPGTVRMQMHRGLDLLRKALPAGFAAAGAGALVQTRGLAAIREQVLSQASASAAALPVAGASAAGSIAAGSFALTTRAALLGAAGLLAAALVWTAWRSSPAPLSPSPEPGRGATVASGTAQIREPSSGADARTLAPENPGDVSGAARTARAFLRGRVLGLAPGELAEVRLEASGLARFEWPRDAIVQGGPDGRGEFELDVTSLFAAGRPRRPLEELVLAADHPRYVREETRIPVEDVAETDEGGSAVYRIDVELAPAALVCGRVELAAGLSGQERSSDAKEGPFVALVALAAGKPVHPEIDRQPCGADGSFCLRARGAGEYLVVAIAGSLEPRTLKIALFPGAREDVGLLEIAGGETLDGSVLRSGVPAAIEGALVSATPVLAPDRGAEWFPLAGRRLLWNGERFERGGAIVETDAEGRFHVGGLAARSYSLRVARTAAPVEDAPTRMLLTTLPGTVVAAPAERLSLPVELATIHLRLHSESAGPRARVRWSQGANAIEFQLDRNGHCSVAVVGDQECTIQVDAEGCFGRSVQVRAPRPGDELACELALLVDPQLARVLVQVRVEEEGESLDVAEASFQFTPLDADGRAAGGASFVRRAQRAQGVFTLDGLPAGRWSVAVHAGDEYLHYRDGWCPSRFEVTLLAGSEVSRAVELRRGGRLQVAAADEQGNGVAAECTVRGPGGEELEVRFLSRKAPATLARGVLSAAGPSDVLPALAPGDYEIELRAAGFEPTRRSVRIEARRLTRVRVVLAEGQAR